MAMPENAMTGKAEVNENNGCFESTVFIAKENGEIKKYGISSGYYGTPTAVYGENVLFDMLFLYDGSTVKSAVDEGFINMWVNLKTGDAVIYRDIDTETGTKTVW